MAASWQDEYDERRRARGREADARARTFEWTSRRDRLPPLDYSAQVIPVSRSAAAASQRRSWPYPSDSLRTHSKRQHRIAAEGLTPGAPDERPISRSLPEFSTWSRAEWPVSREDEGGQAPFKAVRVSAAAHRSAPTGDFSGSVHRRPTVDDRPAVNQLDLGGFRDKTSSDGPNLKFTESVSGADEAFLSPRRRTDGGAQQRQPAAAYSLAHLVHPSEETAARERDDFRVSPPALNPPPPGVGTTTAAPHQLPTAPAAADPVPEIEMASPNDDEPAPAPAPPLPPATSDTPHQQQLSSGGPARRPSCSRRVSHSSHHSATSGPSVSAEMSRNPSESGSEAKMSLAGDVSDGDGEQPKRRKRTRVLMTHTQQTALFKLWKETKFPTGEQRDRIAGVINLTPRQVQVWFQNQRQKARKQIHHAGGGGEADDFPDLLPSPSGRPQSMDSVVGSPWALSSSSYPGGPFSSIQSPYAPSGALPLPPPPLAAVPPPSRGGYGYPPPPATAREPSFASRHGQDYPPQHTRPSTSEAAYGPYRNSGLVSTSYYPNPAGFQSPPLTGSSTQSYWGGPPPDRLGSSGGASGYWDRPGSSRDRDRNRPSSSAHFQLHRQSPFSFTALPFSPPPSSDGPGPDSYFARNRSSKSRSGESARQKSSGSDYSRSTRPPSSWSWGQPRPHSQQSQQSQRPQSSQSQSFPPPPPPPPLPPPHAQPPHGVSSTPPATEWKRSMSPPPAIQPPQHLPPELAKLAITRPVSVPSEPRARDILPQISPAFSSSPTHIADIDYPPPPQAAMRYDRYDERPYDRYDRGPPQPPPAVPQGLSVDLRARSLSYDAPKVELGRSETLKRRARDRSQDGERDRSKSRDRVATLPSLRNMLS